MKETKRKFYKKICKWKKQILCVGAGIFLGIAAWLAQGMDPVIEAGNVIQRPDIDDGQVDQELYVKGACGSGEGSGFKTACFCKAVYKRRSISGI